MGPGQDHAFQKCLVGDDKAPGTQVHNVPGSAGLSVAAQDPGLFRFLGTGGPTGERGKSSNKTAFTAGTKGDKVGGWGARAWAPGRAHVRDAHRPLAIFPRESFGARSWFFTRAPGDRKMEVFAGRENGIDHNRGPNGGTGILGSAPGAGPKKVKETARGEGGGLVGHRDFPATNGEIRRKGGGAQGGLLERGREKGKF